MHKRCSSVSTEPSSSNFLMVPVKTAQIISPSGLDPDSVSRTTSVSPIPTPGSFSPVPIPDSVSPVSISSPIPTPSATSNPVPTDDGSASVMFDDVSQSSSATQSPTPSCDVDQTSDSDCRSENEASNTAVSSKQLVSPGTISSVGRKLISAATPGTKKKHLLNNLVAARQKNNLAQVKGLLAILEHNKRKRKSPNSGSQSSISKKISQMKATATTSTKQATIAHDKHNLATKKAGPSIVKTGSRTGLKAEPSTIKAGSSTATEASSHSTTSTTTDIRASVKHSGSMAPKASVHPVLQDALKSLKLESIEGTMVQVMC